MRDIELKLDTHTNRAVLVAKRLTESTKKRAEALAVLAAAYRTSGFEDQALTVEKLITESNEVLQDVSEVLVDIINDIGELYYENVREMEELRLHFEGELEGKDVE